MIDIQLMVITKNRTLQNKNFDETTILGVHDITSSKVIDTVIGQLIGQ